MKPIYLTLLNGTGFIFDIDDYMLLRKQHRIVGSFVGLTNGASGYGLPVELSILETRLLVEQGIALLVSKADSLLRAPSTEETLEYAAATEKRLSAQADVLKAERVRDAERNIEHILAGKRKKLERAGQPPETLTAEQVLNDIAEQFVFEKSNALIEVACAHVEQHEVRVVQLPFMTPSESLKYRVFCDYWQRGKFVTPGDAFGADFLIYPGDPMLYHASHIIVIVDTPTHMQPLSLISKVRLAVGVNKICMLAYAAENAADETVHYQTIDWDGNNETLLIIKAVALFFRALSQGDKNTILDLKTPPLNRHSKLLRILFNH